MMDPQQEIFTSLLVRLRENFDVYDGELPPDGVAYPFIYIGQTSGHDDPLDKFSVFSTCEIQIHCWHDNPAERGILSDMMASVKNVVRSLSQTNSCRWLWKDISQSIIPDDTTGKTLMHGIINCRYEMIGN